jgi:hypothetical protein
MSAPVSRIDLAPAKLEPDSESGRLFVKGARFRIHLIG